MEETMQASINRNLRRLCAVAICALFSGLAPAQDYPARPVTLLCWSEPGSPVDLYARLMAKLLTKEFGQNVLVDNRTGGDGIIMINHLLKSPADGYTIAANTLTLASLFSEPTANFKPDDLQMVARSQLDPYGLIVPASSPFKSIDEFVGEARKQPGKLNVGGPFQIGSHRVAWEAFAEVARFRTNWIAYKGGGPALLAVAGGHVDATATNPGNAKPFITSGKVRVLAVSSDRRLGDFPEVPTYKERGWDVVRYQWRGIMGKAGLPAPVLDKLVAAIQRAQQTPEWKAYLDQVTQLDGFLGPAGFKAQLLKDIQELEAMKKKLDIN
jgi:tripartite-type tricarboxylate transporter receptor subunit TctC